jgi:hypothetical protein
MKAIAILAAFALAGPALAAVPKNYIKFPLVDGNGRAIQTVLASYYKKVPTPANQQIKAPIYVRISAEGDWFELDGKIHASEQGGGYAYYQFTAQVLEATGDLVEPIRFASTPGDFRTALMKTFHSLSAKAKKKKATEIQLNNLEQLKKIVAKHDLELCYVGDPMKAVGVLAENTDSLMSDMFGVVEEGTKIVKDGYGRDVLQLENYADESDNSYTSKVYPCREP